MNRGRSSIIRDLQPSVSQELLAISDQGWINSQIACNPNFSGKRGRSGDVGLGRHKDVLAGVVVFLALFGIASPARSEQAFENAIVVTQLPSGTVAEQKGPLADGMLRADFGDGARLVIVYPDSTTKILSQGFDSACDSGISFDGAHILFAGKKKAADNWNIFEIAADGTNVRQVTQGLIDCRSPSYQAKLYTIVSDKPWYQLTFVGYERGILNEYGSTSAGSLYSCKLDGSDVRRLTFNLSSDMDPYIQSDGRLLFASWQRSGLNRGLRGRVALFGINIDGTDYAAFCTDEGMRIKHMPCTTANGLAVFVEADTVPWDGAGSLGSVSLRRPLHSYRPVTKKSDGLFHSPSPLPDGGIMVSRRSSNGDNTHGVGRLDPLTGKFELVFDDPDYHDVQAMAIYARPEPDGRSSVVNVDDPNGKFYCLDVGLADFKTPEGTARRLRVIEGMPPGLESGRPEIPPLAGRRILGEIDIEKDGSFNIEVPANTPIELQTLDADGMALRRCGWIWAKNREPRGCIGCHEDGELTPENNLADAVILPSAKLAIPPEQRRTVDFKHDVMPIITKKCVGCHSKPAASVRLTPELSSIRASAVKSKPNLSYIYLLAGTDESGYGKYVHPGRARTSPLVWHIFGRNTSRPWDDTFSKKAVKQMPPNKSAALTKDEKRTFVEWIDLGAMWDETRPANVNKAKGNKK